MPEPTSRRLGPLAGLALPTRVEAEGQVGVTLTLPLAPSIVALEARRGASARMADQIAERFGSLPLPGRSVGDSPLLLHSAPDSLLALAEGLAEGKLAAELQALLAETASVVDNSHGRTLIRLGGPKVRELLALGTAVDLTPEAFPAGAGASTLLGHIAVTLLRRTDSSTGDAVLDLVVARGFAESLWDWLLGRAHRFGYEVTASER